MMLPDTVAAEHAIPLRQTVLRVLCLLCAIGWLLAVIGISRAMRLPIDERWAASGLLILEGVIALLWLAEAYAWQRAIIFALIVLPLAFAVEFLGVTTGLPFGRYHYTGALVPPVLGRVPAPITCAWLMIVLGALIAARLAAPRTHRVVTITIAALLATGLDACLEPSAFHVKAYWLWEQSGPYYGVPTLNFVGWFVAAFAVIACAAPVVWRGMPVPGSRHSVIPLALYWSTVVMFAIIDYFRGYPVGTAIGGLLALTTVPAIMRVSTQALRNRRADRIALSTPDGHASASAPNSQE